MVEYAGQMTAYRLFWLLKTDRPVYLVTDWGKEACTVRMTASKPKKVSRALDLVLDPERTFLLCEGKDGGIQWTKPVPFSRDAAGKLWVDVTDLLREMAVPFAFCDQSTLRHYKARPQEAARTMYFYGWGWKDVWDGFAYDSAGGAVFSFFPQSCYICGAEIRHIRLEGFGWSPKTLDACFCSAEGPCRVDRQTACRWLEEQGPLSKLKISSDRIGITAHMFFSSSFGVEGFGRVWTCRIHEEMFQENGRAPCRTHRFGPLLCRLLEAPDAAAVEAALHWAVQAHILRK